MARSNVPLSLPESPLYRYGLAVLSFVVCGVFAVVLENLGFHKTEAPLLLLGIAVTAWYAGSGPAAVSVVLSILLFDYYFVDPRYSFWVTSREVPYLLIVTAFAALIAWFSTVRRRVEKDLREARDRLELEVAERTRQASLLNLTHDTIFVRDMDAIITYWNRGAEELYGFTAEQAIGKRTHDLLQTVFPAALEDIRDELLRTGRWEGELLHTKADGTKVIVSSRWSLQADLQGRPLAILETNNDITERKNREEQIEGLNLQLAARSAELESINKELEAFAYSVSHDLRAPLRHIGGFTELLQKQISSLVNEKANRYMVTILESSKRMGNLIDDLLAFSRIGRAETQKTQVNLDQLVKEALSEVRPDAEGRQIDWRIGTLPPFWGDRSMLRLVLVNLLSNAVKFTRTRPQAEIEVGVADGNAEEQIIFVKDNGVGFDMKYAGKLFGVFQRLHQSDTFEGTGIGLATVQRIIHRHGGRVWAEGAVNQGATFYFSAPKPQGQLWKT
jgi:PAS domain S-box-containing protein